LKDKKIPKVLAGVLFLCLALSACAPAAQQTPQATDAPAVPPDAMQATAAPEKITVTGTGQGRNGEIVVEVILEDNVITAIEVLSHSETAGISDGAIAGLPAAIVAAGGTDVDAVSGATETSRGIIEAVNNALAAARGEAAEPEQNGGQEAAGSWEDVLDDVYNRVSTNQVEHAPEVRTLASGVQVQRTPADSLAYNNVILNADERGCAACHDDLGELLLDCDSFVSDGYYRHFELVNEYGIEITVRQCYVCHVTQDNWLPSLRELIHGIHDSRNTAFEQLGGDCWSCHVVDERTGDIQVWDYVKYTMLHGISSVANVQGEFRYDQDVLSTQAAALNWMSRESDKERLARHFNGETPDPETDGIYDTWTITVEGEVENSLSFTLAELIEAAPHVTKNSTMQCAINPLGGPIIANVQITGIPVAWILEQAGVEEGANIYYCGNEENMAYGQEISRLEKHPAYLVYEINGEPISYMNGYPVANWVEAATAADGRKQCTRIWVTSGEWKDHNPAYMNYSDHGYYNDAFDNFPNVGICQLSDGQIIAADAPYTFEGYAYGFREQLNAGAWPDTEPLNTVQDPEAIAAIEISFDQGATWTRFDTAEATSDRWVYWYFTWTPEAPGSYVISVRAIRADGLATAYPIEKLITVQ